jgi:hypothetical protein
LKNQNNCGKSGTWNEWQSWDNHKASKAVPCSVSKVSSSSFKNYKPCGEFSSLFMEKCHSKYFKRDRTELMLVNAVEG